MRDVLAIGSRLLVKLLYPEELLYEINLESNKQ